MPAVLVEVLADHLAEFPINLAVVPIDHLVLRMIMESRLITQFPEIILIMAYPSWVPVVYTMGIPFPQRVIMRSGPVQHRSWPDCPPLRWCLGRRTPDARFTP
jgi:hypothetical protein